MKKYEVSCSLCVDVNFDIRNTICLDFVISDLIHKKYLNIYIILSSIVFYEYQ